MAKDLATPSSRIGNKPVRSGFRSMTRACQREDWTKGRERERRSAKKIRELLEINTIYYYKSFWFRFFFFFVKSSFFSPSPFIYIIKFVARIIGDEVLVTSPLVDESTVRDRGATRPQCRFYSPISSP